MPLTQSNFDNWGRSFTRVIVMLGCFATMAAVLYVYMHIDWKSLDGATASQLGGVLGIILGAATGFANAVIGYDFGSSQGSEKKTDQINENLNPTTPTRVTHDIPPPQAATPAPVKPNDLPPAPPQPVT